MFSGVDELLIEYCSPTLASIKPANMFSTSYYSLSELESEVERQNLRLQEKGIKIMILSLSSRRALIYVYRIMAIKRMLSDDNIYDFLSSSGYCLDSTETALESLRGRFTSCDCFPHEIGVFLGYPLVDVQGFINENGCNYKCSGCWKVYGSKSEALRYFEKMERCKRTYKRLFRQGVSIEKLTVKAV